MWIEELLEDVHIHDTGNGFLHEEGRAVNFSFAECTRHIRLWAVTSVFQGDTRIFAAPDPAIVGIDLTTNMKHSLIAEIFGVQNSLIVLWKWKSYLTI
jgi:hypothetical protein